MQEIILLDVVCNRI